jgi:hypothetical protein
MNVVVFASVRSGTSVSCQRFSKREGCDGDVPKPDSYSANSLLFSSSSSICSVNFARPALRSAASSAIRGSFLVINTSTIRALREGRDSGLGEEMACRKKIGRNTVSLACITIEWYSKLHLLEASSRRALDAPLSLCSLRLTRASWSAGLSACPTDESGSAYPF